MTIDRARLGKLFGALGSVHEGERIAALTAIDAALQASGLTWAWVAATIATGASAETAEARERLFDRLVRDRLAEGYALQWGLTTTERLLMSQVELQLRAGVAVADVPTAELLAAIEVADQVKRRDPAHGPRRKNWKVGA